MVKRMTEKSALSAICSRDHFQRFRGSRSEVFCKKGVLKNFPKFTGKHLFQSLFFNKFPGRSSNFIEHLWWLLVEILIIENFQQTLSLISVAWSWVVVRTTAPRKQKRRVILILRMKVCKDTINSITMPGKFLISIDK